MLKSYRYTVIILYLVFNRFAGVTVVFLPDHITTVFKNTKLCHMRRYSRKISVRIMFSAFGLVLSGAV